MAFFAVDQLVAVSHGRSLAKKTAAFFRNSFSPRSSLFSALSFAISADSEAFLRSWSVACSFLYLATQLPTVWGTRSYEEATEEMVRSFSMTSHNLGLAAFQSISLLAWDLSYRLKGRKTPPVRETPRTPGAPPCCSPPSTSSLPAGWRLSRAGCRRRSGAGTSITPLDAGSPASIALSVAASAM